MIDFYFKQIEARVYLSLLCRKTLLQQNYWQSNLVNTFAVLNRFQHEQFCDLKYGNIYRKGRSDAMMQIMFLVKVCLSKSNIVRVSKKQKWLSSDPNDNQWEFGRKKDPEVHATKVECGDRRWWERSGGRLLQLRQTSLTKCNIFAVGKRRLKQTQTNSLTCTK